MYDKFFGFAGHYLLIYFFLTLDLIIDICIKVAAAP